MNKFLKITGKVIKWYLIGDVMCWAIVGVAQYSDYLVEHPTDSTVDSLSNVMDDAIEKYKKRFRYFKGE